MAKGQMRSPKEKKKPKTGEKKDKTPKYMRSSDMLQAARPGSLPLGKK